MKTTVNKNKLSYIILVIMLTLFCVLRINRNSFFHSISRTGGIWNLITFFFIAVGMTTFIIHKLNRYIFPKCISISLIYAFIALIHGIILNADYSVAGIYYILMIMYFPFVIIAFYCVSLRIRYTDKTNITTICFYIILGFTLLSLFAYRIRIIPYVMVANVYYPLCLYPIMLYMKKGKKILIPTFMMAVSLVLSGKRAGLVGFLGAIALYYIVNAYLSATFRKTLKELSKLLLIIIFILTILYIVDKQFDLSITDRFQYLIKHGESGRNNIYKTIVNEINKSNYLELLFGHGCGSIGKILIFHDDAHNDFLQIIYEYGVMPLVFFIGFYVSLFNQTIKMIKQKFFGSSSFVAAVFIAFIMSMFSVFAVDFTYVTCSAAVFGIILAQWSQFQKEIRSKKPKANNYNFIQGGVL